ncbi:hypothetical protein I4U23_009853 [Adineta vaga]|nr:hypothetical protein I4U23_009853 [Adineta vaga]
MMNAVVVSQFNYVLILLFLDSTYTRQMVITTNHIRPCKLQDGNSSITTMTFNIRSSCNACICVALMSRNDYKAINCYMPNRTYYLITSLATITDVISSEYNFVYFLSDIFLTYITTTTTTTASSSISLSTIETANASTNSRLKENPNKNDVIDDLVMLG